MTLERLMEVIVVASIVCAVAHPAVGAETVKNPGQKAEQESEDEESTGDRGGDTKTWGLPTVTTTAEPLPREEERIGEYKQPRWTARRRFPTTRVYVRPKGEADFEFWYTNSVPLDEAASTTAESQFELEMGLGHRLQLDLYLVFLQDYKAQTFQLTEEKIELRWALADWGELWGNPTLYFEYVHVHSGPPKVESKVLLGGELGSGWHAGANVVFETELGGERENEYAVTAGISRIVVDSLFSVGGELELEAKDEQTNRFDFVGYEFLVGPSLQVFLKPHSHVDVLTLFGVEWEREDGEFHSEPLFAPTVVVGYEF